MMQVVPRSILAFALFFCLTSNAEAFRPVCLGRVEYVHRLAETGLRDTSGYRLALARKQITFCFLVPYRTISDGLVLMSEHDHSVYYPMPPAEDIHSLQWRGMLPDPLPDDDLPLIDFFFGHLIWAIFFFAGVILRDPVATMIRAIRKSLRRHDRDHDA